MCRLPFQLPFLTLLLLVGCTNYKIPLQTENHPASTYAEVSPLELSSLLEISENSPPEKQESHVHHHH